MIRKNDESGKINSFKRFSEISKGSKAEDKNESPLEILPDSDTMIPGNPNLPNKKTKVEKPMDTRYMKPNDDNSDYEHEEFNEEDEEETNEEKVEFYGKIAKFPKKVKASKAYNFLENVKVSKNSIWYLVVEKQDNELQMVKYNNKKGVELTKFINELKSFYTTKYAKNKKIVDQINNIKIDGNNTYSMIKNIPLIEIDGKKMISRITEDLIKLLSK